MKKEVKECVSYVAEDGTRFESEKRCREYEVELKRPKVYMVIVEYRGYRQGERIIAVCSARKIAERVLSDIDCRDSYEERYRIVETALLDN